MKLVTTLILLFSITLPLQIYRPGNSSPNLTLRLAAPQFNNKAVKQRIVKGKFIKSLPENIYFQKK